MKEEVKHPSRYNQGGIEFLDVEKASFGMDLNLYIDLLVQSALEYGVRFHRKNGAEDLRKGANLLNVAADLLEGKSEAEPVEKTHPLQNMTTPNINDVCYAIETFEIEHDGKKPTVVLVNGKVYNALMADVIMRSAQSKPTEKPNDNTTYIMGVRVVVTESTKNHLDMEVL